MLPVIVKLKLASALLGSGSSAPMAMPVLPVIAAAHVASPVAVKLYDENARVSLEVEVDRDGAVDEETGKQLAHLFRCRRTEREKPLAKQTYAMMADLAAKYPGKPIEFVSAYRAGRGESYSSPHRKAHALDFRIRGVKLGEIRDYLWKKYTDVGIGWYPSEGFIHMDTRPKQGDTAWTFVNGDNRYHPYWAEVARKPAAAPAKREPKPKS